MNKRYLVFVVMVLLLLSCGSAVSLPPEIAGLPLYSYWQGDEALQKVTRLHGKEIPLKKAVVGFYGENDRPEVQVWISLSHSSEEATVQTREMMEMIKSNDRSPFKDVRLDQEMKHDVWFFNGMGQEHAVFRNQATIYWISSAPHYFKQFLHFFLTK